MWLCGNYTGMSLFAFKRQLSVSKRHCVAHGISFPPYTHYLPHSLHDTCNGVLSSYWYISYWKLYIYIKAIIQCKYASRAVSVLITIPDPAMEEGLSWMTSLQSFLVLWFVIQYDALNKTTHCYILVSPTDESLISLYTDTELMFYVTDTHNSENPI